MQAQAHAQQQTQQRQSQQQVPSQSHTPTPIPPMPVPFSPQTLKSIPENDLYLWKPFADVMKVPIGPINDLDTAILYLKSPYLTLKIEALLATQKLFAQATAKELQSAGLSSKSLSNLLESLESLWCTEGLSKRSCFKTMEEFWYEADKQKRDFTSDNNELNKNLMICRQIVSLIRTLTVTNNVGQFLGKSDFIKQKIFSFGLMETDDMELYKVTLIIYDSISPHLGAINDELLKWTIKQCEIELNQVRKERLTGMTAKFVGTLTLERFNSFESISAAKQTISVLISQCAQLWKAVPAHIFLNLSCALNVLTSCDSFDFELENFGLEIGKFIEMFLFPTVSLLRTLRGFLEANLNFLISPAEELKRILETAFYSPNFNLTDGGFIEICLQILLKCQSHQSDCLKNFNFTGCYLLMRELREFWRHSDCQQHVPYLVKTCYQNQSVPPGSPAKKSQSTAGNQNIKLPLAILNGSSNISSIMSHPFLVFQKSLDLLVSNFSSLPENLKFDLIELAVEWNLDTPSELGREVLGSAKIEESIKILREFYF